MTQLWSHDYRSFLRTKLNSPPAIIEEGILPVQSRMIIGGEENVGKTILATGMALDIASGFPFLGLFDIPQPRRVLMWQAEVAEALYQKRLAKSVKQYSKHIGPGYLHVAGPGIDLDTQTGRDLFMTTIRECNAEVVIIDPSYKFHVSDENDAGQVKRFLRVLDEALATFNLSVAMTHHKRKPNVTPSGKIIHLGMADFRGSSVFTGWADSRLIMAGNSPKVNLDMELRHATSKPARIILTLNRKTALFEAEIPGGPTSAEATVIMLITGGITKYIDLVKETSKQLKISPRHAKRIIASCRAKSLISTTAPQLILPQSTTWQTEEDEIDLSPNDDEDE